MKKNFHVVLHRVIGNISQLKEVNKGRLPEIPIFGRSNVGKSSFINHLFSNKLLAKVSQVPGKTQTLNFFLVNEQLFVVDLPGYGFAKTPTSQRSSWDLLMTSYFEMGRNIPFCFVLIDSRHESLNSADKDLIQWLSSFNLPDIAIITKIDKLTPAAEARQVASITQQLQTLTSSLQAVISFTIKNTSGKERVLKELGNVS